MKNLFVLGSLVLALLSCKKDGVLPLSDMEEYVYGKSEMTHNFLIACAAGSNTTFMGNSSLPISIFYYVEPGAENIHLFSTSKDVSDPETGETIASGIFHQNHFFKDKWAAFFLHKFWTKSGLSLPTKWIKNCTFQIPFS